MKSWYVEYLMMNRFDIANNPEQDLETYEDLLDVIRAYAVLKKRGLLTEKEIDVLESVPSIMSASRILNMYKSTVSRLFQSACFKIGEYLGGYFTNVGYIDYMQEKYKLLPIQVKALKLFMNSEYRFRIMRKQYNA